MVTRVHRFLNVTKPLFYSNQNIIVESLIQLLFDCDRNETSFETPIDYHSKQSYAKAVGNNTNKIEPILRKPKSTMVKLKLKSKRQNHHNNNSNSKRRLDEMEISQMIATDPENEISQLLVNKLFSLNRATVKKCSRMPYTMNFKHNL